MDRCDLAARLHLMAAVRPDFDAARRDLFVNASVAGERVDRDTADRLGRASALEPTVDELLDERGSPATYATSRLILDVSDLVDHLARHATLSGIQRVQASVAAALGEVAEPGSWATWVYAPRRREWVQLDPDELAALAGIASDGGRSGPEDAERVRSDLFGALSIRRAASPSPGATLVNLGTYWFLDGYAEAIAALRRSHGIAFKPFVHDLIPVVAPGFSDDRTRAAFARSVAGLATVADGCLVNSLSTKTDLVRVSSGLGAPIPPDRIEVVRLDADFSGGAAAAGGRGRGDFALMVSTFEDRKNHRLLFEAWDRLAAKHGRAMVPPLLCVGRATDQADAILADLRGRPGLGGLVSVRGDVSDGELDALYRDCLFSVYPSAYEGWGLPVTESLARGRVPVVALNSSLVEAGEELALYFESGSVEALTAAVEQAAFDAAWRADREALIARTFRPRHWTDVAAQILAACAPAAGG